MKKTTEETLRRLTEETAKECGVEQALKRGLPDKQQADNKVKAQEILKRTQLPNDWTREQNDEIARQMMAVIDEPTKYEMRLSPMKKKQYDALLSMKIRQAIKNGQLPDPKHDKEYQRIVNLRKK